MNNQQEDKKIVTMNRGLILVATISEERNLTTCLHTGIMDFEQCCKCFTLCAQSCDKKLLPTPAPQLTGEETMAWVSKVASKTNNFHIGDYFMGFHNFIKNYCLSRPATDYHLFPNKSQGQFMWTSYNFLERMVHSVTMFCHTCPR